MKKLKCLVLWAVFFLQIASKILQFYKFQRLYLFLSQIQSLEFTKLQNSIILPIICFANNLIYRATVPLLKYSEKKNVENCQKKIPQQKCFLFRIFLNIQVLFEIIFMKESRSLVKTFKKLLYILLPNFFFLI